MICFLAVLALSLASPFHGTTTLGSVDGRMDGTGYHPGAAVDFRLPEGTPLLAVGSGTVVVTGEETDSTDLWPRKPGRFVLLQLDHPAGRCAFVAYKHLSDWTVTAGDHVGTGEVLGRSGSTQAPHPHLHLDCHPSFASWSSGDWGTQVGFRVQACARSWGSWELRRGQRLRFC